MTVRAEECKMFDCDESDYARLVHLYRTSPGLLLNYLKCYGYTFGIAAY